MLPFGESVPILSNLTETFAGLISPLWNNTPLPGPT